MSSHPDTHLLIVTIVTIQRVTVTALALPGQPRKTHFDVVGLLQAGHF